MSELTNFRKAKDEFFGRDHHSPLAPAQRRKFRGLDYLPENPQLRFVLKVYGLPEQDQSVIEMTATTGHSHRFLRWGSITFEVNEEPATLSI